MGRGRKGILNQSEKKAKKLYSQHSTLFISIPDYGQVIDQIQISDELLTAMKKMSPQALKNTLIQPEEEQPFRGMQQVGNTN